MLFSSTVFLFIFLPAVLAVYYVCKGHRRVQNTVLCLFSLFFYAWGEPYFVLVMMLSIVINWALGLAIADSLNYIAGRHDGSGESGRRAKLFLTLDVILNLALLFVFKYLGFAIECINDIAHTELLVPEITLPIGISFFTFQAMSYVIDVYRGNGKAQRNILNVALYISFFPQLIAGPIVRYETVAEQIENRRESISGFSAGVVRFIVGLGKKIIIANNLALVADAAFGVASGLSATWLGHDVELGAGMAWLGALAYTFQIFFDFSGYSDMAIGLGKMFGFEFLENFNYPYISASVTDFWRRWHISLSTWFRDYLYIPLGGSRCSKGRNLLNLFIVWFLTGIWHGANYTFIVWGLMYFVLLAFERAFGMTEGSPVGHIYTLLFVIMGWVIFRASSLSEAFYYIGCMFSSGTTGNMFLFYLREYAVYFILAIIASVPVVPAIKKRLIGSGGHTSESQPVWWQIVSGTVLVVIFAISVSFIVKGSYNPFIYFNF